MTCVTGKVETVLIDDEISRIWTVDSQLWQKRVGGIGRRITPCSSGQDNAYQRGPVTEIYSFHDAAKYCGEELLFSPSPQDRLRAARVLGRYDAGGYEVQNALLVGLKDHSSLVRI